MNQILTDFVSSLQTKFSDENRTMSLSDWVARHTRLRRKPFTYEGYEFQIAILNDLATDMSVIKPSQVGLSEIQIRKFLAILKRNTGITGIFTLPTDIMFKRLSQTRVKPLVENEPIFNDGDTSKLIRNTGLYQVDDSFGYFTGMTEGAATSIPADFLLHDEIDLSDQATVGLYQSRLQASKFKITQRFGTPTLVGYGIDKAFADSDQHHYLCKCEGCGHWQDPHFEPRFLRVDGMPDSFDHLSDFGPDEVARLDLENAYIKCERCDRPLDIEDPKLRQWVPKYPSRRARGYRVRPFCTKFITVPYIFDQLLKQKQAENLKGWYNTTLGEPYSDSNARLNDHEIRAVMKGNLLEPLPAKTPVFIGIDVGQSCHIVLGAPTPQGLLAFRWMVVPVDRLNDTVEELMAEFPNLMGGAADRHPYTPTVNALRDLTHGRVLPVEYRGQANIYFHKDEFDTIDYAQANRTVLIDGVVSAIRKRHIWFADYRQYENSIIEHLKDMVRIEQPDEPAKWQKVTGNDHFFHALAFLHVATKITELQILYNSGSLNSMIDFRGVNTLHQSASLGVKRSRK
jgi:hypothetical protein